MILIKFQDNVYLSVHDKCLFYLATSFNKKLVGVIVRGNEAHSKSERWVF